MKAPLRPVLRETTFTGWRPRWTIPAHLTMAIKAWMNSAAMNCNPTRTIPITNKAKTHLSSAVDAACVSMANQVEARATATAKVSRAVQNTNRCTGLVNSRWRSKKRRGRAPWMTEIARTQTMEKTPCTETEKKILKCKRIGTVRWIPSLSRRSNRSVKERASKPRTLTRHLLR